MLCVQLIFTVCAGEAKAPKSASIHWIAGKRADPTAAELLFYALRAVQTHAERWQQLQKWAKRALKHAPQAEQDGPEWQPPEAEFGKGAQELWAPLREAYELCAWPIDDCEAIARAMRCWHGDGCVPGITANAVKSHKLPKAAFPGDAACEAMHNPFLA